QKDTPDSKAGTRFINSQNHIPGVYMSEGDYRTHRIYLSETIENNPEWFLIEEEHLKKSNPSLIKNGIMTAEQAREYVATHKAGQLQRVLDKITANARIGNTVTTSPDGDYLTKDTISILESRGFKVIES